MKTIPKKLLFITTCIITLNHGFTLADRRFLQGDSSIENTAQAIQQEALRAGETVAVSDPNNLLPEVVQQIAEATNMDPDIFIRTIVSNPNSIAQDIIS